MLNNITLNLIIWKKSLWCIHFSAALHVYHRIIFINECDNINTIQWPLEFFYFCFLSLFSIMLSHCFLTFWYHCFSVWYYITPLQLRQTIISTEIHYELQFTKSLFLHCQQEWTFAEGPHFPKWCRAGKSHRKYLIQLVTVNMRMCIVVIVQNENPSKSFKRGQKNCFRSEVIQICLFSSYNSIFICIVNICMSLLWGYIYSVLPCSKTIVRNMPLHTFISMFWVLV